MLLIGIFSFDGAHGIDLALRLGLVASVSDAPNALDAQCFVV